MTRRFSPLLSKPVIQLLCRFILGGIFIYASIDKIAHPFEFAKIVHNYRLLPDSLVYLVSLLLPWFELVTGVVLVMGIFVRTSTILLTGLLAVFIGALVFNLARGLHINCGCFTVISSARGSDPVLLIFRDLLMLIPGLVIIFFHPKHRLFKR